MGILSEKRNAFKSLEKKTGAFFSKLGLSPNQYTLLSLFLIIISFYFLINAKAILALLFFLLAAFSDFIDGAVARYTNKATLRGAYLDTICDRYVEGIILLGFLFVSLPTLTFPPFIWIFLALFGAMMTTYAKAAAKEKGLNAELKKDVLGRGERVVLIALAIVCLMFNFTYAMYALIILAVFSNISALQRIVYYLKN